MLLFMKISYLSLTYSTGECIEDERSILYSGAITYLVHINIYGWMFLQQLWIFSGIKVHQEP